MLFRKYHVVVFKDGVGQCRKLRIRSWSMVVLALVFLGLIGSNIYFFRHYSKYRNMEKMLTDAEKITQEQKTQILSFASKIKSIEKDLSRISDFDSKLRVMINLEQGTPQQASPIGGPATKDFSKDYLTLHRHELLARKMHNYLKQLSTEAKLEEVRQQELMQHIRDKQDILASTPSIWPTEGWVSSKFGYRNSPFTGKREFHRGLDISGPSGTPIFAPSRGTVIFTGRNGAYGNAIAMDHGSGLVTKYAHLSRIAVKNNQVVTRGELIGYMGNTGRSTGPHLHYEVRVNGVPVNPMRYILN